MAEVKALAEFMPWKHCLTSLWCPYDQDNHLYAEQLQSLHYELQLLLGQLVRLHCKNREVPSIVLLSLSF